MNKLKYLKIISALIFVLITLSLSSCAVTTTPPFDDGTGDNLAVKFNIISQGEFSNISLPNQLVIRNKTDWLRLLKIQGNTEGFKHANVDFYDNIVIAVFAGQQPTGGYSVGVSNIKRVDSNLYVTVTFTEPKKNETVSLALTQPYIMISTAKVDGKIIFLAPPTRSDSKPVY